MMDKLAQLCNEYSHWQLAHGLVLGSADEHIHDENLTESERLYLKDFCRRWNQVLGHDL